MLWHVAVFLGKALMAQTKDIAKGETEVNASRLSKYTMDLRRNYG